jgi:hypothetical protein
MEMQGDLPAVDSCMTTKKLWSAAHTVETQDHLPAVSQAQKGCDQQHMQLRHRVTYSLLHAREKAVVNSAHSGDAG